MKNILKARPSIELSGRLLASVEYVSDHDVKNKEVLDVGCGFGWCELNFLGRGVKNITGIEISELDLETIRSSIDSDKLGLKVAGATELPFANSTFDTVVAWEVLEHIPRSTENTMFSEVYRVLKPGGVFYLSTPHRTFFANIFDPAWWLQGHRHYSKNQLRQYAENSSFNVLEVTVRAGWWAISALLNMYFSKWILRREPILKDFFKVKDTSDYQKDGFMNLFAKYEKPVRPR